MKHIPKLWQYIRPHRRMILIYLLFIVLSTVFALFSFGMLAPVLQVLFKGEQIVDSQQSGSGLVAWINGHLQAFILENDKMTALVYTVIIVIVATILKNLFLYAALYILNPIKNAILRQMRDNLFAKTISLPISFFTEERKGDLVSRMTNDVNEVEVSIVAVLEVIIREPITIMLTLVAMILISPSMTLFMFIFLPIAGIIIGRVSKSLKKPSQQAQGYLSTMMTYLDETIAGMRVVKAFNAERQQQLKFRNVNNDLYRVKNKMAARREAASPMSETLGIIVVGIILLYGGYLIFNSQGSLDGAYFLAFIGFFYQLINPLKGLSNALNNIAKGRAALDRIQEIMNTENAIKEIENPVVLKRFYKEIKFQNVGFRYGDKWILKDINLTIPKGKMIALVGASGAGKSTLVDLIPRFHDVSEGIITIDGTDIRDLKIYDYRKMIGMVSQDPILFNDSIIENIKLGTGGKKMDDIEDAARIANAHNFIIKKENSYETTVGDRGAKLSGGERQRITIARAVLKNPPILILDEATSALDTESERLVQDAIQQLMKDRTSIVIAHRLSTIQYADEIVVLHQGEIVERGTHNELMKKENGYYAHLVQMQTFQ